MARTEVWEVSYKEALQKGKTKNKVIHIKRVFIFTLNYDVSVK